RNARDLQNELVKFLTKADGAKSRDQYHSEISDLLSDIFADEIEADRAEIMRLNEKVLEIAQDEGRRLEGQPREFSLEEFSMIEKARPHKFDETESRRKQQSTKGQTTTEADPVPPQPLGKTLVMIQMPKNVPEVPLDGPVNKGVMPEPVLGDDDA